MEAMTDKPLTKPRMPVYKGAEDITWEDVDVTFKGFLTAYYKKSGKKETESYKQFKDCPAEIRKWMSEHSILGNPEAKTFKRGVVLPVVNPATGKLNFKGIRMARIFASRVKGITPETLEAVKKIFSKLYKDNPRKKTFPSKEGMSISNESIYVDDIDEKLLKALVVECNLAIDAIKHFLSSFEKSSPGKLKYFGFEIRYYDKKDTDLSIAAYNWYKNAWETDEELVNKLLNGIQEAVIKELEKNKWKRKYDLNKDLFLFKRIEEKSVVIYPQTGDNDGNYIGPELVDQFLKKYIPDNEVVANESI
jgi:hypothetical protein